eukprot:scaffold5494_cov80-Cylindrotheca_fusiformis.AAC.1
MVQIREEKIKEKSPTVDQVSLMKGENLCATRWLTKLYYNPNPEQLVNLWLLEAAIAAGRSVTE